MSKYDDGVFLEWVAVSGLEIASVHKDSYELKAYKPD